THDCVGSAAHARMLAAVGLLTDSDALALVGGLKRIHDLAEAGAFPIPAELEDGHTAIEAGLVRALGEAGKRIHLGRSRNDQVILALRLWMREAALALGAQVAELAAAFLAFAERHQDQPLPGYTHLRRAMPSSFGQWGAAFAEGLLEELEALQGLQARLDRCPLGAAAGFGVPLPLDRELTARLLGFSKVQRSPIDVQNSRGRHELALLQWVASVATTLEKALWDLSLYSTEEFHFLRLPEAFTTGSSIMPQKRNPDVLELARASCRELRGWAGMVAQLAAGLPSSYHRDFQRLKAPLMAGVACGSELLSILTRLVPALEVDAETASAACTDDLYAAHQAYQLVEQGLPFRDAYKRVAAQIADGSFAPHRGALTATHLGGTGNLALGHSQAELAAHGAWIRATQHRLTRTLSDLWMEGTQP
ncbi:MAG TPA: argininosuccinate lyase, partial [Holophagaceae bacterium]|nr:argininosuccinate lyase [Holophagaceae bacterium]